MYNRRKFLTHTAQGLALLGAGSFPLEALALPKERHRLTILHTNDTHSRIEPFPMDGGKFQGMGGVAKRTALISKIRAEESQVLLLDSGDILQGTPYFNFFNGEPEFIAMNEMGYEAATIGNHDFDGGIQRLAELNEMARFPILNANYDFKNTPLNNKINSYTIIQKGEIEVGIVGVGIELRGLVPDKSFGDTQYLDPIKAANDTASFLRHERDCSLIICLSHLGYEYDDQKVSDVLLAANTKNIDIILGGHTHTFMDAPRIVKNLHHKNVIIHQVGWGGILLGRLDIVMSGDFRKKYITKKNIFVHN